MKPSHQQSFASHPQSHLWSNKNPVKSTDVFRSSRNTYEFKCDICNHEFSKILNNIGENICPYCVIPSKLLCNNKECNFCFDKSFAPHEKAKYWSNKNKLCPTEVFKSSGDKYIFDCNICKHEFIAKLNNIYSGNRWCPYCAKPCKKLCENNECKYCFDKSFASHEKSIEFSLKNNINPRQIIKGSHEKYLFDCKMCNHEYETIIGSDNWCIYCSSKKLCNNKDCVLCFEKSFASHEKSKHLIDKSIDITLIFKGTHDKYSFKCTKNHKFNSSINKITGSNSWCPYCVNKTEQKLYDKLITLYPILQQQFKVDWCKNKTYLPFDFVIPENKIIIELDGRQHFEQVRNWDDPKKTQENDKYKMKCANDNSYSVIRILQEDVFYDTYDWLSELNDNIKDIIKNKKVQNIFMCKDNEYDIFN
jgi:very-short-patch-repair endonuclease